MMCWQSVHQLLQHLRIWVIDLFCFIKSSTFYKEPQALLHVKNCFFLWVFCVRGSVVCWCLHCIKSESAFNDKAQEIAYYYICFKEWNGFPLILITHTTCVNDDKGWQPAVYMCGTNSKWKYWIKLKKQTITVKHQTWLSQAKPSENATLCCQAVLTNPLKAVKTGARCSDQYVFILSIMKCRGKKVITLEHNAPSIVHNVILPLWP